LSPLLAPLRPAHTPKILPHHSLLSTGQLKKLLDETVREDSSYQLKQSFQEGYDDLPHRAVTAASSDKQDDAKREDESKSTFKPFLHVSLPYAILIVLHILREWWDEKASKKKPETAPLLDDVENRGPPAEKEYLFVD